VRERKNFFKKKWEKEKEKEWEGEFFFERMEEGGE
jgi:hypothetical protein